jgi:RHS repeat-associated protein
MLRALKPPKQRNTFGGFSFGTPSPPGSLSRASGEGESCRLDVSGLEKKAPAPLSHFPPKVGGGGTRGGGERLGERASGTYTVTLQDGIGRQSGVGFGVIRDTTPPTLTLAALVQGDVHVTWSATDPDSGVDASTCLLEVREDEGTWQTFSTECGGDDTHDGQPGHTYTSRLSASDNVSNAASLEVQAVFPYVKKYYYANGQRVAMRQEGVVYYIHSDHLGSVSLVTDHVSEAVARQLYHPYGTPRWSQGTLPTDYTFTGQRDEAGLGLMHYGARFYSPRLGRFVSADSIVPEPGKPQALNRYSYVLGNPLRFVDPTGHGGPGDWLTGQFIELGRSGDAGQALVVSAAEAIHHVNWQTQKVFYPDPNTSTTDRFWACVEIGGGSVVVAAAATELAFGTLTAAAVSGGTAEVATTVGTATTAACADGDCTNEANMAVQTAQSAAQTAQQSLNVFSRAAEFGIRSYKELREAISGTGLRAHHIIEQRFAERLGISNAGQMQSVALTPEEHQIFTNAWRSLIGYVRDNAAITTANATRADIWAAAQEIYANYPELLEAARQTVFSQ